MGGMLRRHFTGLVLTGAAVLLLAACSTGFRAHNDVPQQTIQAYQTRVATMQAAINKQRAIITSLTPPPGTPVPPKFASQWQVAVNGKPELKPKVGVSDDLTPVGAKGIFLVVPITVTNEMAVASYFNPQGVLIVTDSKGKKYDLDTDASSAAYVLDLHGDTSRGALQPGIPYPDVLVFDVPKNASGFTLKSQDGSLSVKLGL